MEQMQGAQKRIVVITPPLGRRTDLVIDLKLQSLGCTIRRFLDRQEITFPEGTTKESGPQLGRAIRFTLILPTKETIRCVEMPNGEHYNLLFPYEPGVE